MEMKEFNLSTEYIELIKLLKLLRLVESGGMAKLVVDEGLVLLNGETEFRKRAKVRKGDIVEFEGQRIAIV
ncbi:RNA-binding S4 domain-containing protein [Sunxiuqinia elliptica]|uniref:Ribosome-associated protein n=1 Tax=Sunxiuqinia elliptica TaxID=655355 RepID=A0A1I2BP81_9BACT|nr:RNA-binding S4 domain-containing protein [Sunxiuqinia elliptica]SFE57658.1 ribosome-associated protein [Sunxiuqinia elliptica]